MTPKRQRIIEAIGARLEGITTSNGYESDAGLAVYYGPVVLGPGNRTPAIALVPLDDEPSSQAGGKKVIVLPIEIHVIVEEHNPQPGRLENAWLLAETVLGDVKRAVEIDAEDLLLIQEGIEVGATRPLPKIEGSPTLGVLIEYRLTYTENFGRPDR